MRLSEVWGKVLVTDKPIEESMFIVECSSCGTSTRLDEAAMTDEGELTYYVCGECSRAIVIAGPRAELAKITPKDFYRMGEYGFHLGGELQANLK